MYHVRRLPGALWPCARPYWATQATLFHSGRKRVEEMLFPANKRLKMVSTSPKILEKLKAEERLSNKKLKVVHLPAGIARKVAKLFDNVKEQRDIHPLSFLEAGLKMDRYMMARRPPVEEFQRELYQQNVWKTIAMDMYSKVENVEELSTTDRKMIDESVDKEAEKITRKSKALKHWKEIDFDEDTALSYLIARAPYNYAAAMGTLAEIKSRDPTFQPRTMLDYGCGVGSAIWAVKETFGELTEILAIDKSAHMSNIAAVMLSNDKKGRVDLPSGHFFRIHLPASHDLTYDVVTMCHTLCELPNAKSRLSVVDSLWQKTEGYLVLIEDGSNAGFELLEEAREYLLQKIHAETEDSGSDVKLGDYMFAPCPHVIECPRMLYDRKPCNFPSKFTLWDIPKIPNTLKNNPYTRPYSYTIFKKHPVGEKVELYEEWHRLVEPPMKKKSCTICRMCTSYGQLEEVIYYKKYKREQRLTVSEEQQANTRAIHKYVSRLHWGDQLHGQLAATAKKDRAEADAVDEAQEEQL